MVLDKIYQSSSVSEGGLQIRVCLQNVPERATWLLQGLANAEKERIVQDAVQQWTGVALAPSGSLIGCEEWQRTVVAQHLAHAVRALQGLHLEHMPERSADLYGGVHARVSGNNTHTVREYVREVARAGS